MHPLAAFWLTTFVLFTRNVTNSPKFAQLFCCATGMVHSARTLESTLIAGGAVESAVGAISLQHCEQTLVRGGFLDANCLSLGKHPPVGGFTRQYGYRKCQSRTVRHSVITSRHCQRHLFETHLLDEA